MRRDLNLLKLCPLISSWRSDILTAFVFRRARVVTRPLILRPWTLNLVRLPLRLMVPGNVPVMKALFDLTLRRGPVVAL